MQKELTAPSMLISPQPMQNALVGSGLLVPLLTGSVVIFLNVCIWSNTGEKLPGRGSSGCKPVPNLYYDGKTDESLGRQCWQPLQV